LKWTDVFIRSALGPNVFVLKRSNSDEIADRFFELCDAFDARRGDHFELYDDLKRGWTFLDGGVGRIAPSYFFGL
jgi:hypothetical protein